MTIKGICEFEFIEIAPQYILIALYYSLYICLMDSNKIQTNFQRKSALFALQKRSNTRKQKFEKNRALKTQQSEKIEEEPLSLMNPQAMSNQGMNPNPEIPNSDDEFDPNRIVRVLLESVKNFSSMEIDQDEMNLSQQLYNLMREHGSEILQQFLIEALQNHQYASLEIDASKLISEILLQFFNSNLSFQVKWGFQIFRELAGDLKILALCAKSTELMAALENALSLENSSIREVALNIGKRMIFHQLTFQQFAHRQFLKHYYFLLGESVASTSVKLNNARYLNKILEEAEKMNDQLYNTICKQLMDLEYNHYLLDQMIKEDTDLLIESIFQRLQCSQSENKEMEQEMIANE